MRKRSEAPVNPSALLAQPTIGGSAEKNQRKRPIRALLISIVAAAAFYGLLIAASDTQETLTILRGLPTEGWLAVLGLSLINYFLRFLRWQMYLNHLGCSIRTHRNLGFYIAGFAFTTTPGKAGEAVRSIYLKEQGVAYVDSLAAFFAERLVDVFAVALLAMLAVAAFQDSAWLVALTIAVSVCALFGIHSQRLHRYSSDWIESRSSKLKKIGQKLLSLLRGSRKLLRSWILVFGFVLGMAAWAAEGFALYLIVQYLGAEITVVAAIGIYALGTLAGALSLSPGGLGSTEAVMTILLVLVGVTIEVAVVATLICRVATLWFAVGLGMLTILGLEVRRWLSRQVLA